MSCGFEGDDRIFLSNRDWDPAYLYELFKEDFFDFDNMAITGDSTTDDVTDSDLVKAAEVCEKQIYCPEVEDISMDDEDLYSAVDQIEKE